MCVCMSPFPIDVDSENGHDLDLDLWKGPMSKYCNMPKEILCDFTFVCNLALFDLSVIISEIVTVEMRMTLTLTYKMDQGQI